MSMAFVSLPMKTDAEAELEGEGGGYEHAFGGGIEESEQQVAEVESAQGDAQTTRSY